MIHFAYYTRADFAAMTQASDLFDATESDVKTFKDRTNVSEKTGRTTITSAESLAASRVRSEAIKSGIDAFKGSRKVTGMLRLRLERTGFVCAVCPDETLIVACDPDRVGSIGDLQVWQDIAEAQIEAAAARYDAIIEAQQQVLAIEGAEVAA